MVKITWLIAWIDHTWSLVEREYNGHELEDMEGLTQEVSERARLTQKLDVALVALYHQENLDLEDG